MQVEKAVSGGTTMPVVHVRAADGDLESLPGKVEQLLAADGVVMIRGLGISAAEQFHRTVTKFGDPLLGSYRGGNTPRSTVSDGVFTSTEYPARYEISLHNEMSYAYRWPTRVFFCCLVAAETGGATPVCDGKALLADLDPAVRGRFESLGVVYRQNLHGGFGLGKSWQDTFETRDKAVVEQFLAESGAGFEWRADGGLTVSQARPGVRTHPRSGDLVWFNQADQWHPSTLPGDEGETLLSIVDTVDDLPHWVTYGDGSVIPEEDLKEVRIAAERNKLSVPWRPGDLMVVDNMRVLHGREPFSGNRKVVVSMT